MKLLFGKLVAEKMLAHLKSEIFLFEKKPRLDVVLIGKDEASKLYVALKEKKAREIGIDFRLHEFDENVSLNDIVLLINDLNLNEDVSGMIVQLPLPEKFNTDEIISLIDPKKDVDGFHPKSSELFLQEKNCMAPVFPSAILQLIQSSQQELNGKFALVIANSDEFGIIMCKVLQNAGLSAEYVLANSISQNIDKINTADVVVSAVGLPGLINGQMLKGGAIVIDGGIKKVKEKVLGDIDFASTKGLNGYITPVPGGVGPVTIACLLNNVFLAFKAQQKEEKN
jgi:methylenetetrahydrofolate dehydrogenase (NADP+)/methenyltetrahydrofolate cyclohydrolase